MNRLKNFWNKYAYTILFLFLVLGLFDFRFSIAAIICMMAPVVFAMMGKGRYWCGNICPRGNFYDRVVSKFSNNKKSAKLFKSSYFRGMIIIFMFYMFGRGVYNNWGNLYGIGIVFYRMIVVTTLVGIFLSFFYNSRIWCNFCPMGSLAALITYFKKNKSYLKINNSCVSCKICEKKCPMGITPYSFKDDGAINDVDCIKCEQCALSCPKKSIEA